MGRVDGKVAIVTGGAVGLGRADAVLLAQEGAHVVVTDVDTQQGSAVAEEIGGSALFLHHDVTNEPSWIDLIDSVVDRLGRLDILVNNAGIVVPENPETTTLDQFRQVCAVSVEGTFLGCKYAIPAMKKSGGGSIINMSSVGAINPQPDVAAYAAAKGAVRSYTRAVAIHCAQNGLNIRCNSVAPSSMATPMVAEIQKQLVAKGRVGLKRSGMGELGDPNDVAHAVLYLASDESRLVSGSEIVIDHTVTVTQGLVP